MSVGFCRENNYWLENVDSEFCRIPKIGRKNFYSPPKKNFTEFNNNTNYPSFEESVRTSQNILELQNKLGVTITQKNGQRKLGGPPPNWEGPAPGDGCEIFVGKIPRNIYEDTIYPIFQQVGEIYEMRLMMNFSGTNRGFCFIMYKTPEMAQRAIKKFNNYEIIPRWFIGVVQSVNNCRLQVVNLSPDSDIKTLTKRLWTQCDDIDKVLLYTYLYCSTKKEALICFKTHRGAAMARRRLLPDREMFFDQSDVKIEWADPEMVINNVLEECGIYVSNDNISVTTRIIKGNKKNYTTDNNYKLDVKNRNRKILPIDNNNLQKNKNFVPRNFNEKNRFSFNNVKPGFVKSSLFNNECKFKDVNNVNQQKKFMNDSSLYSIRSDESLSDFSKTSDSDEFKFFNNSCTNSPKNSSIPLANCPQDCTVVRYPWGLTENFNKHLYNFYHVQFPWFSTNSYKNINEPITNHGNFSIFNDNYQYNGLTCDNNCNKPEKWYNTV